MAEEQMTFEELSKKYKETYSKLQERLEKLGVSPTFTAEVIEDLKYKMHTHSDKKVNELVDDLIIIETKMLYVKPQNQEESEGSGPSMM